MTFIAEGQTNHNHRRTEEGCRPSVLAQLDVIFSHHYLYNLKAKRRNTSHNF
jgi:hypothetical protein